MTGAGISTSAGIPDFRCKPNLILKYSLSWNLGAKYLNLITKSQVLQRPFANVTIAPGTGLYSNLARLGLPYPEAVFDISFFRQTPEPFYALAKELYPGKFHPTIGHSFIALLEQKSMLDMLFTQNIDCLERRAGVPDEKMVEAHGSFATQRCIDCKTSYPDDLMLEKVESGDVPHCRNSDCDGLVKPDIVFFGEPLPSDFYEKRFALQTADLIIVMGTSLSVAPFSLLPDMVPESVPRVLINKEQVGNFGCRPDDVMILGDCDEGVRKLADALGWRDELEALWYETSGKHKETETAVLRDKKAGMSKDELLETEIENLSAEIDATLKLNKEHEEWVTKCLEKEVGAAGQKEAIPTPAAIPVMTEKVENQKPAQEPKIDAAAILDVTLPQHRPNTEPPKSNI